MVWNLTFYKLSRSNFIVGDYVCEENIHNLSFKKNWLPWYMKHICQLFILMRVWKVTHIFKMTNWERAYISSVQFSCSVVSDSLWHHESQHPRPPCPSPTSRVHPNPHPLSWWCHPAISFSVVPFSSCPQSFPASRSFQMSQLFASGGQSIGVLASTSVLPMNTQGWSPSEWIGWISLQSRGLSRVFSNTTVQKHQFLCLQLSL